MKATKKRIYLSSPHMGGEELKYIHLAFEQNWIAPVGPNLLGFEKDLVEFTGIPHAVALSSGTAAIHLALIILGVKPGDEVIASTFTFSATINPIVYQGATPVFVDSEPDTCNMSPGLLETAIKESLKKGKKPKAIIVVHLYGMPAKMDEIMKIARRYEIPVIEDAAEAMGSRYKGKHLGSFGDFAVVSFNGNKIITTSGGGALLSNNGEAISKAHFLANQARDTAPHYEHSQIGYNYRMSNIIAGVGRGQMEVLEKRVEQKRNIFRFYFERYGNRDGVHFFEEPGADFYSNYWLTVFIIDPEVTKTSSVELREALERENIESRPLWKPMHLQPVFASYPAYLNGISEDFFNRGLCLPSGTNMTEADMERVIHVMNEHLL